MFVVNKTQPKNFDFKLEGSKKVYSIPLLETLPMKYIKRAGELSNGTDDQAFDYVNDIFEKYAPGLIDELSTEQFQLLIEAYFNASSITLGE